MTTFGRSSKSQRQEAFRGASAKTHVVPNTIRAKIPRLEDKLGEVLLKRRPIGVELTPAGVRLRYVALSMKAAAVTDGVVHSEYLRKADELRIGTSEGLGSAWLTPRLLDLPGAVPDADHVDGVRQ